MAIEPCEVEVTVRERHTRSLHFMESTTMQRCEVETEDQRFSIVIRKSERSLFLYDAPEGRGHLVRTFSIALGSTPVGAKQREGDGATPEGKYYITHKNVTSKYHLSLGLSYPNLADAQRGLEEGIIDKSEYDSIRRSLETFGKPLQKTALGGEIFIHGGGIKSDWTQGCIALDDSDIEYLFRHLPVGTGVTILR